MIIMDTNSAVAAATATASGGGKLPKWFGTSIMDLTNILRFHIGAEKPTHAISP